MNPVITVKNTAQPKPGKKSASLYDTNDQWWGIEPADLEKFIPGHTYSIDRMNTVPGRDGKLFNFIKAATHIQGPSAAGAPTPNAAAPQPSSTQGYGIRDQQIFVQGNVQRILGNPSVNPLALSIDDRINLVNEWRYIFDVTFGGKPRRQATGQQFDENVGDEIPF